MGAMERDRDTTLISPDEFAYQFPNPWQYLPHTFAYQLSDGKWIPFKHLLVLSHLVTSAIARGNARILVSMPPRHGKSQFLSKWLPAWFLSNWPDQWVMLATYEANFAASWGRQVRNILTDNRDVLRNVRLSEDSQAAAYWMTTAGGGMATAGAGGPITGKGFHLGLIDDPHKNWKEAMSETIRASLHDWFDSTFYTRGEPGSSIIVQHCMTGDTPVLMADGVEKELRDIRPGDHVATRREGRLGSSTVLNFASNGLDKVYEIKMTSGIVVKANERHPFLVNDSGGERWVRVRDLSPGQEIYRVSGESGKARSVGGRVAKSPSSVVDIVNATTIGSGGLTESVLHLAKRILHRGSTRSSRGATESRWRSIIEFLLSRMAYALFAGVPSRMQTSPPDFASITAMTLGKFEDCSVTTAICSSRETLKSSKAQSDTFVLDKIESISYSGIEEVFDIQVAETENFIANRLVSHNTRWHEDDMIGHLIVEAKDDWVVIRFPAMAEAEDQLERKLGEALCPERYDIHKLRRIKNKLSKPIWDGLFQQRPSAMEGEIFLKRYWKRYLVAPKFNWILQSWDTGSSTRNTKDTAWTVCHTWGIVGNRYYLIHRWRDRVEFPELLKQCAVQYVSYMPRIILIEKKSSGIALLQTLERSTTPIPVYGVEPDMDKVTRAKLSTTPIDQGRVFIPEGEEWDDFIDTLAAFPNTKWMDDADAVSQALSFLEAMTGQGFVTSGMPRIAGRLMNGFRDIERRIFG